MQFNFDEVVDRRGTRSVKWESFSPDVLPLWVADTDFSVTQSFLKEFRSGLIIRFWDIRWSITS